MPVPRHPATSQPATPSEATPFSYWSIKPWFLTEGKLAAVLIIPFLLGFPIVQPNHHHHITLPHQFNANKIFWCHCTHHLADLVIEVEYRLQEGGSPRGQ